MNKDVLTQHVCKFHMIVIWYRWNKFSDKLSSAKFGTVGRNCPCTYY